jgi:hypothetical protein
MTNVVTWRRVPRLPSRRLLEHGLLGGSVALNVCFVGSITLDAWTGLGGVIMAAHAAEVTAAPAPPPPEQPPTEQHSTATLLSVLLLENAAGGSGPFAGELAYAMRVAEGDAVMLAALDRLMRWAEAGVPGRAELLGRFLPMIAEARAATEAARTGLTDRATLLMRDAALSVGIGTLPPTDPEAIIEHARAALVSGRLDEAVTRLGNLPNHPGGTVARWREEAGARLSVEVSLRELRSLALARALR